MISEYDDQVQIEFCRDVNVNFLSGFSALAAAVG